MTTDIKPLVEINQQAIRLLYHEPGVIDAVRFIKQYTQERDIVLLRENYANREDSAVIATFGKQSHPRRGDCFPKVAMTGRFGCGWRPRYVIRIQNTG